MFLRGSRYAQARELTAGPVEGVRPREIGPATGVIEHVLKEGDRPDLLARHYYNDARLWWRILDANPDLNSAADLLDPARVGEVVLIPRIKE